MSKKCNHCGDNYTGDNDLYCPDCLPFIIDGMKHDALYSEEASNMEDCNKNTCKGLCCKNP